MLRAEETDHNDVLRVAVRWNETRLRGPVLSVAAWLRHAIVQHASAHCIAKLDDDAYIYAPGLEVLVREALAAAPHPESLYMGPMSWFHWYPRIFERSGFGWTFTMSWHTGRTCRNETEAEERCQHRGCGACEGPFPFTSGYLSILSTRLAAELVGAPLLHRDVAALSAVGSLPTRTGGAAFKVMEDIWMGSLLFRHPAARPLTYVALSERDDHSLVSDEWGLKVTQSSVVVHVKNHMTGKQLERFLMTHTFKQRSYCEEKHVISCAVGCRAFLTRAENLSLSSGDERMIPWVRRVNTSALCTGRQQGAAYCRIGSALPRTCVPKPQDLLKDERLINETQPAASSLLERTRSRSSSAGFAQETPKAAGTRRQRRRKGGKARGGGG